MTTVTTRTAIQQQQEAPATDARQLVSFCFYRVDPAWRRLPAATKRRHSDELRNVVGRFARKLLVQTYSLVGLKADVDFLIWRVGTSLEDLQEMSAAVRQTALAGYLTMPYSYLSMTKRSTYVDKLDPDHQDRRRFITPAKGRYLFVYPFVKTHEWYQLPFEKRQAMMDEHIILGNKYPSVRIHTTYSFGLDDQEFVVAFETDTPQDFLDLVMEMRESRGRPYTLRDTPIFTCVAKPFAEILKHLGDPA
jgi:chlorite dismutase